MIKLKDVYEAIIAEQGAMMNKAELKRHYDKLEKLKKYMEDQGDEMIVYPDLPNTVMNAKLITKESINEIGDSTFPFKKEYWSNDEILYTFNVGDDKFDVNIFPRSNNAIEIDFQSDYSWETTQRNKDTFKIISTIKAILIEAVRKLNQRKFKIDTLIYNATAKKANLYKMLVKASYPNAQFKINQYGGTEVKFT